MKKTQDYLWGFMFALLALIAVNQGWDLFQSNQQWQRDQEPISDWFVPSQIYIPDFKVGEDPKIIYDRTIKQPFQAIWSINLRQIVDGGFVTICSNIGLKNFDSQSKLPSEGYTVNSFMAEDCKLKPGKYQMNITWNIVRDSYKNVSLNLLSNIFTVSE